MEEQNQKSNLTSTKQSIPLMTCAALMAILSICGACGFDDLLIEACVFLVSAIWFLFPNKITAYSGGIILSGATVFIFNSYDLEIDLTILLVVLYAILGAICISKVSSPDGIERVKELKSKPFAEKIKSPLFIAILAMPLVGIASICTVWVDFGVWFPVEFLLLLFLYVVCASIYVFRISNGMVYVFRIPKYAKIVRIPKQTKKDLVQNSSFKGYNPISAVVSVLFKYATFEGRATRSEFWYYFLSRVVIAIALVVATVIYIKVNSSDYSDYYYSRRSRGPDFSLLFWVVGIFNYLLLIPEFAVIVRRLHDIGKSAWYLLLYFFPIIGWIVFFVWFCKDSEGDNQYGPSEKYKSN